MAARKAKGRQAVRTGAGAMPAWAAFAAGLVVGALLMFAMRDKLPIGGRTGENPQPNAQATAPRAGDAGMEPAASTRKPQYDFYSVLSEREVRIPDEQIRAQARAEQQKPAPAASSAPAQPAPANAPRAVAESVAAAPANPGAPAAGGGYLLQVGAFPNAGDAEALKARLALQGFVANVQTVDVNGQAYHRVRLGPFRSATELEAVKQRLAAAGIRAIALKEGR